MFKWFNEQTAEEEGRLNDRGRIISVRRERHAQWTGDLAVLAARPGPHLATGKFSKP